MPGQSKSSSKLPIIIGAGPAGVIASLYLSKWKQDHVLLDRADFPRPKVCGESYDGKLSHILNDLDPTWLPDLFQKGILQKSWSYSLTNSRNQRLQVDFPKDRTPRLQGSRWELDDYLVQKAKQQPYCQFWPRTAVKEIKSSALGKQLLLQNGATLETKLVILATGAQATLSKVPAGEGLLFARTYYEDLQMPEVKEVEVFFFRRPVQACLILCPLPKQRVNVEIGVSKKEFQAYPGSFDQLLSDLLGQNAALQARFSEASAQHPLKGTFLHLGNRQAYAEDHLLRAGSAVGSVNPITGYGVGHAMTMGREAARMTVQALSAKAFLAEDLAPYEQTMRQLLRDEMRLSSLVSFFHRHVGWLEPIISWLGKRQHLEEKLADRDFVRSFYRPGFYFRNSQSPGK